jgi:beta-lactamase regulating signal transducer with metallopeptidase domain
MDGSKVDLATSTTHVAVGTSIARVGRTLLLALLALWIVGTLILLLLVANARNRRPRTPRL